MTPLFLIPIGLYAIVATVSAEVALENAKNPADKRDPKVSLTETIVPTDAIDNAPSARPNPVALATTAGLEHRITMVQIPLCDSELVRGEKNI